MSLRQHNTSFCGFVGVLTWAVEPEPTFRRWSRSRKFRFRFHSSSSRGKLVVQIMHCFSVFIGPNDFGSGVSLLNVEAGAGVKNFRCLQLEPEPGIWVPAPQPWF